MCEVFDKDTIKFEKLPHLSVEKTLLRHGQ